MAALAQGRNTPEKVGEVAGHPVKAATICYQGGIAVLDGGYAAPGRTALNLIAVGRFEMTVDNSGGGAGALQVSVREGCFKYGNSAAADLIAQANAGVDCYIVDDQTVALTNGGGTRSRAGKIEAVDPDGVWVRMGLGV